MEGAYLAGYSEAKGIHIIDNVEYIDLGLPSGTLWSSRRSEKEYTFEEARLFNLPSVEQIEELYKACIPKVIDDNNFYLIGPNGNKILMQRFNGSILLQYWCMSDIKSIEAKCFNYFENRGNYQINIIPHFPGNRLPFFLVSIKP